MSLWDNCIKKHIIFFPSHRVVNRYVFRLGLSWKLRNFENGCHFGGGVNFFPEVALESEDITKIATTQASRMFCTYDWLPSLNINEVTMVQNFDTFLNMVTSSMKQLTIFSTGMVIQQWYIYTISLMIIPRIVLVLSRKMCQFNLNMNTEGRLCRHSVTSSLTSTVWEIFFKHNLHMVFPFLMSNWSYAEQVNFCKKWRKFEVGADFFDKSVTGSELF